MRGTRSPLFGLIVCLLCGFAPAGCDLDGGSVVIAVRDESNRPVEGVEIQSASGDRIGVTGSDGTVEIKPPRSDGEALVRAVGASGSQEFDFDPSYRITEDDFRNGKKFIRARAGVSQEETTASVRVTSEPASAQIFLNGALMGTTDTVLRGVPLGQAEVVLTFEGMRPDTLTRWFVPGENPEIHRKLVSAEITTATLFVTSDPSGGAVYLNGKNTGEKTPATFADLAPGTYRVKITLGGYSDYEQRVTLQKGSQGRAGGALDVPRARAETPPRDRETSTGGGETRGGGDTRSGGGTSGGGATEGGSFSKSYIISAVPGWAEVYVDGDPVNRNIAGNFKMTLAEGTHHFRVVNNQAGVNTVLKYEVRSGDRNGKLLLNYETGRVEARP